MSLIKQKNFNLVFHVFTKIWDGLSKKRKLQVIGLSLISVLSGLSEMLTLASLVPFLSVISDPERFWNINLVKNTSLKFNIENANDLLPYVTIIFIIAVIFAAFIRSTIKISLSFSSNI